MDFGKAMYNDHGILVSKEATLGEKALLESKKWGDRQDGLLGRVGEGNWMKSGILIVGSNNVCMYVCMYGENW